MAIRLRKRNKKGLFIILLVLAAAAAGMMVMYPVFAENSDSYRQEQERPSLFDYWYTRMLEGTYVLYQEAKEIEQGRKLGPEELFLTEGYERFLDNQADVDDDLAVMNRALYEWKSDLEDIRKEAEYVVIMDGTIVISHVKNGYLEEFLRIPGETSSEIAEYFEVIYGFVFDSSGRLFLQQHIEELSQAEFFHLKDFYYRSLFDWELDDGELSPYLSQPRDIEVYYGIPKGSALLRSTDTWWHMYVSYLNSGYFYWFTLMMVILGVLALILGKHQKSGIRDFKITNLYLETSLILVIAAIYSGSPMLELVMNTNEGFLLESLMDEPLIKNVAVPAVIGTNFACWLIIFGCWFLGWASLVKIFTRGVGPYLAKKSLVCKCFKWVKKKCGIFYNAIYDLDLDDSYQKWFRKFIIIQFLLISFFSAIWFFGIPVALAYSVCLYLMGIRYLKRVKEEYQLLLAETRSVGEGNLAGDIPEHPGLFSAYRDGISNVREGFQRAVEKELASQNMKTELITNVSHDLKTPLTAIITYINLLQEDGITEKERQEYIRTIDQKAGRLKVLIEDLFEISKAESKSVSLHIVDVDLGNLLKQVELELEDKIKESGLVFRSLLPADKVILPLDSQKTYRIFENLYLNCVKYSLKGSRVYVELTDSGQEVCVWVKNTSAEEIGVSEKDLSERFVRGDLSRNTEGSGLGLAIARSFTEVQGGYLTIMADGDFFKVGIHFPKENLPDKIK